MTTPISMVGRLAAAIKTQLSARPETSSVSKKIATTKKSLKKNSIYSAENLEHLIGERVKQIDPDDANRGRKAFRVFLETILLSHFGEELINDPKFYQMVDDIQRSMESSPEVNKTITSAVEYLLSHSE